MANYFSEFVLFVIIASSLHEGRGEFQYGSVVCHNRICKYQGNDIDVDATAKGSFNDTLLETGWGVLDIASGTGSKVYSDADIMYGAGFLEGVFTAKRIYEHYQNMKDLMKTKSEETFEKLSDFYVAQDTWTRQMIELNSDDPFWIHVGLIMAQYDGLVDGYRYVAPKDMALDDFAFQFLNAVGDNIDLLNALNPKEAPDWTKMSHDEVKRFSQRRGMCSALIKVLGAYEDIFMSHSSWFVYQATLRIYKHYNFNVKSEGTSVKQMSFSSYPGFLESLDDFYLLGGNMVMLQTTNNVFNMTLYSYVQPKSLFAWQRVRVANMMANSGKDWAYYLGLFNSGTYNNQYMILDLRKIQLGRNIMDDALWVVEQIPTKVSSGDQTEILRTGYWPSYNVPFFEDIYKMSGYPAVVSKHGQDFSYQLAPRAKIFRRDAGKVVDLKSMKHIMRYNDYQHDTYSENNSCDTICCRGDLLSKAASPDGCYDTKVADFYMAQNLTADIINGPTLGSGLAPFQWSARFNVSHTGLPPMYNFDFMRTSPRKFGQIRENSLYEVLP